MIDKSSQLAKQTASQWIRLMKYRVSGMRYDPAERANCHGNMSPGVEIIQTNYTRDYYIPDLPEELKQNLLNIGVIKKWQIPKQ